jgi:hypothetical protein
MCQSLVVLSNHISKRETCGQTLGMSEIPMQQDVKTAIAHMTAMQMQPFTLTTR